MSAEKAGAADDGDVGQVGVQRGRHAAMLLVLSLLTAVVVVKMQLERSAGRITYGTGQFRAVKADVM